MARKPKKHTSRYVLEFDVVEADAATHKRVKAEITRAGNELLRVKGVTRGVAYVDNFNLTDGFIHLKAVL